MSSYQFVKLAIQGIGPSLGLCRAKQQIMNLFRLCYKQNKLSSPGASRAAGHMARFAVVSILPTAILLGGCQNDTMLKAATEYAKISEKTKSMFPAITADYLESCLRSANYKTLDPSVKGELIAIRRDEARRECTAKGIESTASVAAAMTSIHELISAYLTALGGLSADKSYGKEIASLAESVKGLPGIGNTPAAQETIDASKSIASVISKYLTKAYRAREIRQAVLQSDDALSKLVYALSTATYYGYLGGRQGESGTSFSTQNRNGPGLAAENRFLNRYYGEPIRESMLYLPRKPTQDYIEVKMNNEWIEAQDKLDAKRAVAIKYLKLLKDIACDHTNLRLMIQNNTAQKASDVNRLCKAPSEGGLQTSSWRPIKNSTLEDQFASRLNMYLTRMKLLSLEYNKAYGYHQK